MWFSCVFFTLSPCFVLFFDSLCLQRVDGILKCWCWFDYSLSILQETEWFISIFSRATAVATAVFLRCSIHFAFRGRNFVDFGFVILYAFCNRLMISLDNCFGVHFVYKKLRKRPLENIRCFSSKERLLMNNNFFRNGTTWDCTHLWLRLV